MREVRRHRFDKELHSSNDRQLEGFASIIFYDSKQTNTCMVIFFIK